MSGAFRAVKTWPGYSLGKDIFGAALGYESGGTLGSAATGALAASRIGNRPGPGVPTPPLPPGQDTAANSAAQQAALLRRRRGVLGTIFAGGSAAQPTVSSKSSLGT